MVPAKFLTEIGGNKRAGDTDQHRNDTTARIATRSEKFGDGADDQAD